MKHPCKIILRITLYALLPALLLAQAGWGPDVRLTYRQGYSYDPRAACNGDTIHLVWWESYAHEEVFYKRSTDTGETWGDDVRLSEEDTRSSVLPTVGVHNEFVHVVWTEQNVGVCYRKSTDEGLTWLAIDTLPNAGLSVPWIHVDGSNLYVIAGAGTGFQMLTKSTDNGNTWQSGQPVTHACGGARLLKIDSLVLVIANPDDPYCIEIFFLKSYDDGQSWNTQCISDYDSAGSQCPAMDTDESSGVHITWYDYKYSPYAWTGDIFYRASRDSGITWEPIDSLTTQHRARHSDILAEGNNLHLVWDDDRNGYGENEEIYYRMSMDLGQTWGNEVRLTDALCHSRDPSLACDGNYLHLFWSDLRDDSNNIVGEIYYKRKDLSQGVVELESLVPTLHSWFELYPTLFSKAITIRCSAWSKGQRGLNQAQDNPAMPYAQCIKVYDITGKEVIAKREMEIGSIGEKVQMDTKDLPCGVYFVELQVGKVREVHKVVKIK